MIARPRFNPELLLCALRSEDRPKSRKTLCYPLVLATLALRWGSSADELQVLPPF